MKKDDCYQCAHHRDIPNHAHIACAKPDPAMTGNEIGVQGGWFEYPSLFDPIWKIKECRNFSPC